MRPFFGCPSVVRRSRTHPSDATGGADGGNNALEIQMTEREGRPAIYQIKAVVQSNTRPCRRWKRQFIFNIKRESCDDVREWNWRVRGGRGSSGGGGSKGWKKEGERGEREERSSRGVTTKRTELISLLMFARMPRKRALKKPDPRQRLQFLGLGGHLRDTDARNCFSTVQPFASSIFRAEESQVFLASDRWDRDTDGNYFRRDF